MTDVGVQLDAVTTVGVTVEEVAAQAAWSRALGVFDLETTGVDTAVARIVTAHVGVIDETGAVVERKDWIVDPGVEIPEGAARVHGISTERARRFGRSPYEVVPEIIAAIRSVFERGFPLVVYNAPYDLTLLAAEAARVGVPPLELPAPIVDPLVLDKAVDRYRKGKRTLEAATAAYGVPLVGAHDAGADAIAAGRLAQAIAVRFAEHLDLSAVQLHEKQVDWCREQAARFEEYMQRTHDPAFTTSGAWPCR
jgi:DNA polymerase-3 subunit epsilon